MGAHNGPSETLVTFTSAIVTAHVSNNRVALANILDLIRPVQQEFANLGESAPPPENGLKPAVPVRTSVKPHHLVSPKRQEAEDAQEVCS